MRTCHLANPCIDTAPRTVNGIERNRPIALELGCYEDPQAVTYQLGRRHSRFEAVVAKMIPQPKKIRCCSRSSSME